MTIAAEVLIAEQIPADEAASIVTEFTSIGLQADLRVATTKRSIGDVAWLILAALPLQPFFSRLAEDAADDAHERLKDFVSRVLHRRRDWQNKSKPCLVLQDTDTGVQVVLEPDLPVAGYKKLLSFDLTTIKHGPLHYDLYRRRWRSELDEQHGGNGGQRELTGD